MKNKHQLMIAAATVPMVYLFTMKMLYGFFGIYLLYLPIWDYLIDFLNSGNAPNWMIDFNNYAASQIYNVYKWPAGKLKILVSLIAAVVVPCGVLLMLDLISKHKTVEKNHLSGVKRVEADEFFKIVQKYNRKNKRFRPGVNIHPKITMPVDAETEHIAVLGSTGAGKTSTILSPLVAQVLSRGDKVILFDIKGDFTEAFGNWKKCNLLAPWDERSVEWDLQKDVQSAEDCELLADALVCDLTEEEKGESKTDFFKDQGKLIISAMLKTLFWDGQLTWQNISTFMDLDLLRGSEASPGLLARYDECRPALEAIARDSDQTQATKTTLNQSIGKWIAQAARAFDGSRRGFSIREWIESPGGGVLLLRYDRRFKNFARAMCVAMSSLAIENALVLPQKDNRIWLVMDELANFPAVPNLGAGLSLGRDRGLRCVFATQDITQLYSSYGKEKPHTFLNQCSNQIWMKINDHRNAKLGAESIGTREVEIITKGTNASQSAGRHSHGSNVSRTAKIETTINEGELQTLKHSRDIKGGGSEAFIKLSGIPFTTLLRWPRQPLQKKYQNSVPANWINARPKPVTPPVADAPAPDDLPMLPSFD